MPRSLLALLICVSGALAGGGPETTLLVVNGRSPTSRLLANEYRRLRHIPASHMIVLDTVPHDGVIPLAVFREAIWKPLARHLENIDLIVYSADFPYGVDFRKELGNNKPGHQIGGVASLTGVTYLIREIEKDVRWYDVGVETNRYFRLGGTAKRKLTVAEQKLYVDAQTLQRLGRHADARKKYEAFLEAAPDFGRVWVVYAGCLAALRDYDAAFDALEKGAARGFNQVGMVEAHKAFAPMRNDKRWKPVLERIRGAIAELKPTRGFSAAEFGSCMAIQLAYTGFKGNSIPEVLASVRASVGADGTNPDGTVYICKNGNVRSKARERFFTPLMNALKARGRKVELLDNSKIPMGKPDVIGAVVGTAGFNWGTSKSTLLPGAIAEHLTSFGAHFGTAGQTKLAEFIRYGAAGSAGTVIEPLALPHKFPNPMIHALYADGCTLAEAFYQSVYSPYQLMIVGDGLCQPFARAPEFKLEVPKQPWSGRVEFKPEGDADFEFWRDGKRVGAGGYTLEGDWHDFRVVAIAKDRIRTRASRRFENGTRTMKVKWGRPIKLRGKVYYGSKLVSENGVVPSELVGPGPVRLMTDGGAVDVEVTLTEPRPGSEKGEPALGLAGDVLVTALGPRSTGFRLRDQLAKGVQHVQLSGAVFAPRDGIYQFNVNGTGNVELKVGGDRVVEGTLGRQSYGLCVLGKGWHEFAIDYNARGAPDLEIIVAGAAPRVGRIVPDAQPEWTAVKDGYEVTWKKTPKKKIAAVAVLPAKGVTLGAAWTVETRRSKSGKWKPVKDLKVLLSMPATRPAKGKKNTPLAVELIFKPEKNKYFRLTPKSAAKPRSVLVTRVR